MQNTGYWKTLTGHIKRVMKMLWFKIATLVITSAVSFTGSLVALRREDYLSWVIAMVITTAFGLCYVYALGVAYQRKVKTLTRLMRAANARYQAQKASTTTPASSQTD